MSQPHNRYALRILHWVENVGLIVILLATLVASFQELQVMVVARKVTLTDLLLLFLYLEIFTMLGLYYKQGKLPVRYPIYIAIVALARYVILGMKEMDEWRLLGVAAAILMLTLAVLALRYGHTRFPYREDGADGE
ncbi:phosphate-starvation-inducible protein PsiE [Sulfuriferula sp.]|uniref:phosphate-starvation-inducible protein PsiE n=1 Tax=Sulfuriferula sp. TaxID=2025307 RepID=UPI00273223E8|nr:phosphate-starvation-inducible PsiE family protein [Sulfuriferula sp.]MDP2024824.1 phosphate-starvation-inducible PsiE family protein [Sulfuriferula sp.]